MKYEMGNICNTGQKVGSRPPRDLTGFIRETVLLQDTETKENRIQPSWEQEFRTFLKNKNQDDLINCLEFVLETERIRLLEEEEKDAASRKRLEEIRTTKLNKLRDIGTKYFSVQSDTCIPLSNQVLLEEAGSTLRGLEVDQLEDGVILVSAAREDNRVWKSGLDSAYRHFLVSNPNPTLRAVLLSIL